MTRSLPLIAALFLASTATAAYAAPNLTKADVEKIIVEFLDKNPEVILKSVANYQEQQQNAQKQQASQALQALKNDVFNNPDSPAYGPKDGVKVVYFYDYNCPACKMMFNNLEAYMNEHKDIRIIFKEYPIFGEQSENIARVALAVYKTQQDKYYAFHTGLMKYQGRLDQAGTEKILASTGLDVEKIKKEAAKQTYTDIIADTTELAQKLGATGTPLVIIGDEVTLHALTVPQIVEGVVKAKQAKK